MRFEILVDTLDELSPLDSEVFNIRLRQFLEIEWGIDPQTITVIGPIPRRTWRVPAI